MQVCMHRPLFFPISRGIDDEYIGKFAKLTESCVETNNNQEKAKAEIVNQGQLVLLKNHYNSYIMEAVKP